MSGTTGQKVSYLEDPRPCGQCGHAAADHWTEATASFVCTRSGCGCTSWWSMPIADVDTDVDTDAGAEAVGGESMLPGTTDPTRFRDVLLLTASEGGCWHAVDPTGSAAATPIGPETGYPSAGWSLCGRWVRVARAHGVFERVLWGRFVCPVCAWTLALRAGVAAVGVEAARWADPAIEPLGRLLVRVAVAIARARSISDAPTQGDEGDEDSTTVQLLAAVSAHAPLPLYQCSCLDGDCDCGPDPDPDPDSDELPETRPGPDCPVAGVVCPACSLPVDPGLDEDEVGVFLGECTVRAPCQVLATIAASFGVPLPMGTAGRPTSSHPTAPASDDVTAAAVADAVAEVLVQTGAPRQGKAGAGWRGPTTAGPTTVGEGQR